MGTSFRRSDESRGGVRGLGDGEVTPEIPVVTTGGNSAESCRPVRRYARSRVLGPEGTVTRRPVLTRVRGVRYLTDGNGARHEIYDDPATVSFTDAHGPGQRRIEVDQPENFSQIPAVCRPPRPVVPNRTDHVFADGTRVTRDVNPPDTTDPGVWGARIIARRPDGTRVQIDVGDTNGDHETVIRSVPALTADQLLADARVFDY